jgi:molybdopterin/thiamine biosynthesis adenylyltransferase
LGVELGITKSCPCFHLKWGRTWAAICPTPMTMRQLPKSYIPKRLKKEVFSPICRIASGLALQEILMVAGKVPLAAPLDTTVIYNASGENGVSGQIITDTVDDAVIDVVGAGGIGVHFLESIVPVLGSCELRIFDHDLVNFENLPLQTPYTSEDVGKPKAVAIAEKLEQTYIQPGLRIMPQVMPYQNKSDHLSTPNVRIVCVDNFAVRKYANDLSIIDKVPLVEAGSSPLAAQQRTYYPGLTACLEHRIPNLAKKVAAEIQPDSCSLSRSLTLPGTNMIIAGILAFEALKVLNPKHFGKPSKGTITYDGRVPLRFGVLDFRQPCQHDNCINTIKKIRRKNDVTTKSKENQR